MAINRLIQGSLQSGLPKFDSVWDGRSAVGSMEPISAITLSAAQPSVEFNNIPGTYSHLQIRCIGRNTVSIDNMGLRFNGDSGTTNYRSHYFYGDGTTAGSGDYGSGASFLYLGNSPTTASTFAGVVIDILDYASTSKNKTIRLLHGYDLNGSGVVQLISGLWINSSSAITSISLIQNTRIFAEYSSFTLYGIK